MPDTVYRPTRNFCNLTLKKFGVATTYYDPLIGDGIIDFIRPEKTTILLESPGSQTFEIQDIPSITRIARERGIKTIVDNTWATPVFSRHTSTAVISPLKLALNILAVIPIY